MGNYVQPVIMVIFHKNPISYMCERIHLRNLYRQAVKLLPTSFPSPHTFEQSK